MELKEHRVKNTKSYISYTYYIDEYGNRIFHGKHTAVRVDDSSFTCFWLHDKLHGEYKSWDRYGEVHDHLFYFHGKFTKAIEFKSDVEKTLFRLQYPDFRFIED